MAYAAYAYPMARTYTSGELMRKRIGELVHRKRTAKRMSQTELGRRAGKDQATISKIEGGDYRAVTVDLVIDLAYGLECAPEEILDWPFGVMHVATADPGRPRLELETAS